MPLYYSAPIVLPHRLEVWIVIAGKERVFPVGSNHIFHYAALYGCKQVMTVGRARFPNSLFGYGLILDKEVVPHSLPLFIGRCPGIYSKAKYNKAYRTGCPKSLPTPLPVKKCLVPPDVFKKSTGG